MDHNEIFNGRPEKMDKVARQLWARTVLERVIDGFIATGTVPDAWESSGIAGAIGAYSIGQFDLVIEDVVWAMTPVGRRGELVRSEKYSIADLSIAFQQTLARGPL